MRQDPSPGKQLQAGLDTEGFLELASGTHHREERDVISLVSNELPLLPSQFTKLISMATERSLSRGQGVINTGNIKSPSQTARGTG